MTVGQEANLGWGDTEPGEDGKAGMGDAEPEGQTEPALLGVSSDGRRGNQAAGEELWTLGRAGRNPGRMVGGEMVAGVEHRVGDSQDP